MTVLAHDIQYSKEKRPFSFINADGEEEETFFDSRGWVRSDSEDEYFSSNICSHEAPAPAPPLEETKELVELFQDPFWSDVLTQRPNINDVSIHRDKNKIQLVELLEDWSWKKEQVSGSAVSKNPTIFIFSHPSSSRDSMAVAVGRGKAQPMATRELRKTSQNLR
ncbi:hypothetical protein V6N13_072602 [Hibiscus sabdariffa]|uniref:Uncharacterized protein n=1 Tax=Hibiscus sabdariffa TaxID=183260 RepID=A0ABR2R743_9ROSI